ncbi:MAG: hypothetical protein RLZZ628_2223 [Bacteroidota bacterium]|jgi:hypothetical protein
MTQILQNKFLVYKLLIYLCVIKNHYDNPSIHYEREQKKGIKSYKCQQQSK